MLALLPVNPPEPHALSLIRSVKDVEIRLKIIFVSERKAYGSARRRIYPAYPAYVLVLILKKPYTLRGVKIDGDFKAVVVQIF